MFHEPKPGDIKVMGYGQNYMSIRPYKVLTKNEPLNPDLLIESDEIEFPREQNMPLENNPEYCVHEIRLNEYLSNIAMDLFTPMRDILDLNCIPFPDNLRTGQKIIYPQRYHNKHDFKYQLFSISLSIREFKLHKSKETICVLYQKENTDEILACFNISNGILQKNVFLETNTSDIERKISDYNPQHIYSIKVKNEKILKLYSDSIQDNTKEEQDLKNNGSLFLGMFNEYILMDPNASDFFISDFEIACDYKNCFLTIVSLWKMLEDEYKQPMIDEYANYVANGCSFEQLQDYFKRLVKMSAIINGKIIYQQIIKMLTLVPRLLDAVRIRNLNDDWRNIRSFNKSLIGETTQFFKRSVFESANKDYMQNSKIVSDQTTNLAKKSTKLTYKFALNQANSAMNVDNNYLLKKMVENIKESNSNNQVGQAKPSKSSSSSKKSSKTSYPAKN